MRVHLIPTMDKMQRDVETASIGQGINSQMDQDAVIPRTTMYVLELDQRRYERRRREKTVMHMHSDSSVCKKLTFPGCMDTDD